MEISIHAAREGGDTEAGAAERAGYIISIHAAREGGDVWAVSVVRWQENFNPRRP